MLSRQGPYPQIVLPPAGGYWMDGVSSCTINIDDEIVACSPASSSSCVRFKLETDDTSHCYRRHFVGRVIFLNLFSKEPVVLDPDLGPCIFCSLILPPKCPLMHFSHPPSFLGVVQFAALDWNGGVL